MKNLSSVEVRQMFIDFFKEKGHGVEPSASLIPHEDPTLLWINSGVATLKKYFDGRVVPENPRIVNVQKSIRTNDIENVGFTARHHTFFEMLGNFSIGDYFKEEAIEWGWEFLTSDKWIGFDENKLSVTVHPQDDEAYNIWKDKIGLPEERIIRIEENFWDIGEGPSGPNTEIFYDRGESFGNNLEDPELYPGGENERYLEIWNLVFSQFNHNPDNTYTPLPKKNIDTGMGLERIVSVVQGTRTNFETDLFLPLIKHTEEISGRSYDENETTDAAFKVIADHIRTVAFSIGDGALPSNEGRGYVLRRLLRRAVRFAKQLGIDEPFLYKLVPAVAGIMEDFYPEVKNKESFIQTVIKSEEQRFHETLNEGLDILSSIMKREAEKGSQVFPGEDVFLLYDTYGFPKELTVEYVEAEGFTADEEGFRKEMENQRERARSARQKTDSMQIQNSVLGDIHTESKFVGYDLLETESVVTTIVKEGAIAEKAEKGETVYLMLDRTPFYAESGGQIADRGFLSTEEATLEVTDVQNAPNNQNLHEVTVKEGSIGQGEEVRATVDRSSRSFIVKNHTATHLLHQALKDILGEHVNQAGSLVESERLRFDFSHFGAVTEDELKEIENAVNEKIWQALPVSVDYKTLEEAKREGAMALFGEKYGEEVRVISISDYSLELCGGCHVANTSEIGVFKIQSETGIGAGTRRIEALTSKAAYELTNEREAVLRESGELLKARMEQVPERIQTLHQEIREMKKENESLTSRLSNLEASSILDEFKEVNGVNVLAKQVEAKDMNALRAMMDDLKQKVSSGIILLATPSGNKVQLTAGVSKDLVEKGYHAGNLVKGAASRCGGGGGGRPDMAQAGGKDTSRISEALDYAYDYVSGTV
ncbi:alanine--tRNA ligase [Salimicrobium jeotgali]|uniref:Alanine--tRNA ligase n=1 Tax=Salimicrobium jeotgali TaxID=1230341 RepID=K2GAW3_9BACI|nr:alanine--tRNA ligase [Salimicrobium jeotgali]AKG04241.1 alanine--tRNA ligase [Salimicrobium jeotgali]EKE32208.1 alanyl-tRNA ligase [Salimicrobium jeotgali]MBM7695819.1 alanyl-tRNA synthetase [Salimicrobium jeotgali]